MFRVEGSECEKSAAGKILVVATDKKLNIRTSISLSGTLPKCQEALCVSVITQNTGPLNTSCVKNFRGSAVSAWDTENQGHRMHGWCVQWEKQKWRYDRSGMHCEKPHLLSLPSQAMCQQEGNATGDLTSLCYFPLHSHHTPTLIATKLPTFLITAWQ